jgi:hypothetical protein
LEQKFMVNFAKSWIYISPFIVHAQNVFFKQLYIKIKQNNYIKDTNSKHIPYVIMKQDLKTMLEILVLGLQ